MVTVLIAVALVLYLGASGTLAASFAGGRGIAPRAGMLMTTGAVLLHGAALFTFVSQHAELPLVGLAPSLVTLAFLIALFLFAATIGNESRPIGLVLVPLIAALLAVALVMGVAPTGQTVAYGGLWFSLHVLLAFVGYAGLATAFAAGVLYLLQFRELKSKRLGRVFRYFPSLPALDTLGRRGLLIGFPALSLALLLGWAWTVRFRPDFAMMHPQVIWGVLTWFTFAAVFGLRLGRGADSQRTTALGSVVGFLFVLVAYVVLRVLLTGGREFL